MSQIIRRGWIFALMLVVLATSIAYSRLTGQPRIVEVTITIPDRRQNMTLKEGLLELINLTGTLAGIATGGPKEMGVGLEEVVLLIQVAENSTNQMWGKLRQEIVDLYFDVFSMTVWFGQALVRPEMFVLNRFEDPRDASHYSEKATQLGVASVQQEELSIELAANRTLACATSRETWITAGGKVISVDATYVLIKEGDIWKYRAVDWETQSS